MYQIKYIIVNDSTAKSSGCDSRYHFITHIGHCVNINCGNRTVLIGQICKLRKKWPDAKILGVSELDISARHAPVRVNHKLNALRRELSDLP